MKEFKSVNDVLDFAIEREEEAYRFYTDLAAGVKHRELKKFLSQFALEEKGHRAKLAAVKKGKLLLSAKKKVMDLAIADYLVPIKPGPDLNYREILVLAMKKEKAAFKLYTDLAAAAKDAAVQDLFLGIAQEEAKHKLRFELEYDKNFLPEN